MFKTAVIGLGDISKVHIPILQSNKNISLVAVCDENVARADTVPSVKFYESAKKMFEEEKLDVVHICLPHYLHYPMAKLAAQYNVNVFCEKPLALNAQQAQDFAKLEQENPQIKFCVCLQNRYNKTTLAMLDIVKNNQDGMLTGIRATVPWQRTLQYYDAAPWRGKMQLAGGGVMINQSVHTLDIMQLLGGEIEAISGNISSLLGLPIEVEDTATASIRFRSKAVGLFFATNANSQNASVEIELIFEKAVYFMRDNCLYKKTENGALLICEDDRLPGTKFYYGASHQKAIDAFYESLATGSQNYIHAAEGVTSMKMIDAIVRSSETKQEITL